MAGLGSSRDFRSKPLLVFWETTRACLLSCSHCRASALTDPLPGQLTTEEGRQFLEQVRGFGEPTPVVVCTGGDPMMRKDIFDLLGYAEKSGVPTAVSPSVTDLLSSEVLFKLKALGVRSLSISIDGANPSTHDKIRGIQGTFTRSLGLLTEAVRLGLNVQVNTAAMQTNLWELADIFHLVRISKVKTWEVFFLIRIGRASEEEDLTPMQYEEACNFLYDASRYDVTVRAIEAPFIRRIFLQRNGKDSFRGNGLYRSLINRLTELEGAALQASRLPPFGTLDGDGIIFVAHDGSIYPGGFLPLSIGNVKRENLVRVYRENELLLKIRNRELVGVCGVCKFKANCGGSRARAYSYAGNALESDPACALLHSNLKD